MRTSKESISFIPLLLYVSVALAILTQCFLEASLLRTAMYATWMFLFFLMLALRRFKFKISRATFHFYCAIVVFVLYVLVQSFFTDMKALNGYYISGLALIAFIYTVGVLVASAFSNRTVLFPLLCVYIAGSFFDLEPKKSWVLPLFNWLVDRRGSSCNPGSMVIASSLDLDLLAGNFEDTNKYVALMDRITCSFSCYVLQGKGYLGKTKEIVPLKLIG